MSKYLIKTVETYRVDTEPEANKTIEEAKKNDMFELSKYQCEYKEKKLKGEVIDAFYLVTLTKNFTEIVEPEMAYEVIYKEAM